MLAGIILETSHIEHITGEFSIPPFPEDLPETLTSSQGTRGDLVGRGGFSQLATAFGSLRSRFSS